MCSEDHEGEVSLESLIARYLEAENSGQNRDRDALLKRHPEHADSLREFFASHDPMQSVTDVALPAGLETHSPADRASDNVNDPPVGEPSSNDDLIEVSPKQQKPLNFVAKCCTALAVITSITILFEVARVALSPFPETFQWSMIAIQMLLFVAVVVVARCKFFVAVRHSMLTAMVATAVLNVGTRWATGTPVYRLTMDISKFVFVIAAILALPASLRAIVAVDRNLSESARKTVGLATASVVFSVIGFYSMQGAGMYFVGAFLIPWGLLSAILMLMAVVHALRSSLRKE